MSEKILEQFIQVDQLMHQKAYSQAIAILEQLIKNNPINPVVYRKSGIILMHISLDDKALEYLNKARELAPDDVENWIALGFFYQQKKKWSEALKVFSQALNYRKDDKYIYEELLKIYREIGEFASAFQVLKKLRTLDADNDLYQWYYAQLLKASGKNKESLTEYNKLLENIDTIPSMEAVEEWYALMVEANHVDEARKWLRSASMKYPENAMLKLLYGFSCEDAMDYKEAYKAVMESYQLDPKNLKTVHALGYILGVMGNIEEAKKYHMQAVELNPLATDTLRVLGDRHQYRYGDPLFEKLNFAAAYLSQMNRKGRMHLHYALGKAYDDVGELQTAFEHYKEGGKLHLQERPGKIIDIQDLKELFEKTVDREFIKQHKKEGSKSDKPVFIVGMPRSGTTLIEQVLSGIDGVYGAGELVYINQALKGIMVGNKKINPKGFDPFAEKSEVSYLDRAMYYLQQLEASTPKGSKRVIDKMPTNFMFLGLIHVLFPNASIIHSRRHPVETCLSAYRILFTEGHYWSDDLREMGKYYRTYVEMMEHWKQILPEGTILDIRYEDMVSDMEQQSKCLAKHIGMEWDASCLKFYETQRAVRTASVSQVRKPVYTTSVNRWHRYEPYLQPLLEEIGDLVEAYEKELVTL